MKTIVSFVFALVLCTGAGKAWGQEGESKEFPFDKQFGLASMMIKGEGIAPVVSICSSLERRGKLPIDGQFLKDAKDCVSIVVYENAPQAIGGYEEKVRWLAAEISKSPEGLRLKVPFLPVEKIEKDAIAKREAEIAPKIAKLEAEVAEKATEASGWERAARIHSRDNDWLEAQAKNAQAITHTANAALRKAETQAANHKATAERALAANKRILEINAGRADDLSAPWWYDNINPVDYYGSDVSLLIAAALLSILAVCLVMTRPAPNPAVASATKDKEKDGLHQQLDLLKAELNMWKLGVEHPMPYGESGTYYMSASEMIEKRPRFTVICNCGEKVFQHNLGQHIADTHNAGRGNLFVLRAKS